MALARVRAEPSIPGAARRSGAHGTPPLIARSKERIVQCDGEGVLVLGGRRRAVVPELEHLLVGLVVAVLQPPDEPFPDLVLRARRRLPQRRPVTRRPRRRADALRVGEVFQPDRPAELVRPVVGSVTGDPPPG